MTAEERFEIWWEDWIVKQTDSAWVFRASHCLPVIKAAWLACEAAHQETLRMLSALQQRLATAEAEREVLRAECERLQDLTVDSSTEARTLRERVAQAIKDIKAEEDLSRSMARGTCNKDRDAWQHWCGRLRGLEIALIHTRELTPPPSETK